MFWYRKIIEHLNHKGRKDRLNHIGNIDMVNVFTYMIYVPMWFNPIYMWFNLTL